MYRQSKHKNPGTENYTPPLRQRSWKDPLFRQNKDEKLAFLTTLDWTVPTERNEDPSDIDLTGCPESTVPTEGNVEPPHIDLTGEQSSAQQTHETREG